jgi:hypothetical protein
VAAAPSDAISVTVQNFDFVGMRVFPVALLY